ncbi:MAG: hypothetical protein WC676_07105 [Candidatus Omnitrophota bacterium]
MNILAFMAVFFVSVLVWAQDADFTYSDQGKRDPLWRLVTPSGSIINYDSDVLVSDMILEGIIFDPSGKSLAIINGNVVEQNRRIGPFVVSKIEAKRVTLTKGQENFVLELKKEE